MLFSLFSFLFSLSPGQPKGGAAIRAGDGVQGNAQLVKYVHQEQRLTNGQAAGRSEEDPEMYDSQVRLMEVRLRAERAAKRAELRATLGPAPELERIRPFARKVIPLPGVVDIVPNGAGHWSGGPQAA